MIIIEKQTLYLMAGQDPIFACTEEYSLRSMTLSIERIHQILGAIKKSRFDENIRTKLVYRQSFDRMVTTANFDSLFEFRFVINEGCSLSLF
jgi:hypothetical protein